MALKLPFITRPPKKSVYHDWSLFNFNNLSVTTEPVVQKKDIESLLSAVNNSSQHVRNFYVTFLLAGIYIVIIIWSTNDVMLLKKTPVNLPLLNAELPITGFYTFAPYFYLLLHFNLLLQLCLLSDKLHCLDHAVSGLFDQIEQKFYYTRLFPLAFSHTLSGRQHSGVLKFLLTAMVCHHHLATSWFVDCRPFGSTPEPTRNI